jgi:hypothetical protein
MRGPRDDDTRRAIDTMRQLRRAGQLPVVAETGNHHEALPDGHRSPLVQPDLSREEPSAPD